jgi:hypothetical protein
VAHALRDVHHLVTIMFIYPASTLITGRPLCSRPTFCLPSSLPHVKADAPLCRRFIKHSGSGWPASHAKC